MGKRRFFHGESNNSDGIGILENPNLSYSIQNYKEIIIGRMQALDLVINDKEITIINTYGPNNDNAHFYQTLSEYLQENGEKAFIIGGETLTQF